MVHYVTFILERIALFFFPNLSLKYWHGYTQLFGYSHTNGQRGTMRLKVIPKSGLKLEDV